MSLGSDLDTIPVRDATVAEMDDVNDEDEELDLGLGKVRSSTKMHIKLLNINLHLCRPLSHDFFLFLSSFCPIEELADALLEEDRRKASQMNVKVDVHGTQRQVNGTTQGRNFESLKLRENCISDPILFSLSPLPSVTILWARRWHTEYDFGSLIAIKGGSS